MLRSGASSTDTLRSFMQIVPNPSPSSMNIGDEGESPWGDVPGSTPSKTQATPSNGDHTNPGASNAPGPPVTATAAPVKTPGGRGARGPRRGTPQSTRLEVVDDPLGPLGAADEPSVPQEDETSPPKLPQKEGPAAGRSAKSSVKSPPPSRGRATRNDTGFEGHNEQDEGYEPASRHPRVPPPVEPPLSGSDGHQRHGKPSMSIEQAAKPSFSITVGDPHKVGDLTSSHTMYQVRTRTTSKAYRRPEFEVSRRYRDFLWLYNQLHSNNPGTVVPPPPEKQAVGRFDANFVESRRMALEKMLAKTAAHPILQHDGDLKLFLESDTFNVDMKQRERKDPDMPTESKGVFSSLNLSVGSGAKFVEHDDWFQDRRLYLDTLDAQLKALLRSLDTAIAQRRALSDSSADLAHSLATLSDVELSPTLTAPLASLADLQLRLRDLHARHAQHDSLTLAITIDEYTRLIASIRKSFDMRTRSWSAWHVADADLAKRRSALDKLMRQGRSQQDKMSQLQADVGDAERRAHQARLQFDDIGRGMRSELERFEREKVEDFRMGVETYLESAVEAQKEVIEIWETYLMRLDADEGEVGGADVGGGGGGARAPTGGAAGPTAGQQGQAQGMAPPGTAPQDRQSQRGQAQQQGAGSKAEPLGGAGESPRPETADSTASTHTLDSGRNERGRSESDA